MSLSLDDQHSIRGAEPWFPHRKQGATQPDTVTGEVVSLDSVWSDYNESSRVATVIREADGKMWSIRTYPTRLHDEWLRARPQVGETVSVRFIGMLERKRDGREYPDYSVAVERDAPGTFNYGRLAPDEPSESESEELGEPPPRPPIRPTDDDDDIPF